jgi:hypothetical protein
VPLALALALLPLSPPVLLSLCSQTTPWCYRERRPALPLACRFL